jgi:hypothetical protein
MPLAKKKRNYQIGGPVQQMMPQGLPPMPPQGMQMPPQGMPPMMPQRGYQIGGPVQQRMPPQGMPFNPNLGQPPQGMPPQGMPPMPPQGMPPMPPQGMPPRGLPPQGMPMMPQRGIASFNSGGSVDDTLVPWSEIGVVTEEQQAKTDQILREMRAIAKRHQEKATKKAAKKAKRKAKRKARKAGKPKITEEAGLAAPWVIEEQIIRPSGMQLGGPVQQRMPPQGMPFDPNLGQPPRGTPPMAPPQMGDLASQNFGMPPMMPPRGMPPMMPPQGMPPMMPQRGYQIGGPVQQRMPPQGMPPMMPPQGMPPMMPPQGMPMMPPQGMPMMPQGGIASFIHGGRAVSDRDRRGRAVSDRDRRGRTLSNRDLQLGRAVSDRDLQLGRAVSDRDRRGRTLSDRDLQLGRAVSDRDRRGRTISDRDRRGLPSISNINKRLKKLEGQSISDKDLDEMTKMNRAVSDKDKKRGRTVSDRDRKGRTISDKDIGGINTMKEKTFDYASPEQQTYMADVIRREAVKDPELNDEQRALIPQMTDNQIMEMVEGILAESQNQEEGEETIEDKAVRLLEPLTEGAKVLSANTGGRIQGYNLGGLASMGRGGDSQLAHVMPGERMVPPGVIDDSMMDAAFVKAGLDPREYTVGSAQASTNPMTGVPEYGIGSFVKRLWKKVKKLAPIIGSIVGFRFGGPLGAGVGKAIGGVLKSGDVDFKDALVDFGTGWALGSFAQGAGWEEGPGGSWKWEPTPGGEGIGGLIQSAGAKLTDLLGGEMPIDPSTGKPFDIDLMEDFKDLGVGGKLGVIALGLGALSQTGMFDEEELGEIPPELRAKQQDIYDYVKQPLRPAVQGEWGAGPTTSPEALTDWKTNIAKSQKTKSSLADFFENKIGLTGYPAFS